MAELWRVDGHSGHVEDRMHRRTTALATCWRTGPATLTRSGASVLSGGTTWWCRATVIAVPIDHDRELYRERNIMERGIRWLRQMPPCHMLREGRSGYLDLVMVVVVRHWLQNPSPLTACPKQFGRC